MSSFLLLKSEATSKVIRRLNVSAQNRSSSAILRLHSKAQVEATHEAHTE
jgi:hypothetical protein